MESNQELMILSLLNLYTSYVNLNKKTADTPDKKHLYSQYATKQLQSISALSKERVGSRNLKANKKTISAQKENTLQYSRSVNGRFSTDPEINDIIIDVTAGIKKENSRDNCESFSNRASSAEPNTKDTINDDEGESTADNEMEKNVETPRKSCKKTNGGKERDPNRKQRIRRWRVRPINMDRFKTGYHRKVFVNVKKMDEQQFFEHTRMSKSLFDWLLSFVQSSLRKNKQSILPEERLALTLNYLAYGTPLQSLAWKHKVGKSTARQIVLDTCSVLWSLLSPFYCNQPTTSQYADIAEEFKRKWYIPNCVGAIDGKKVSIRIPREKDNSNLLILGACDTNYKFSAVSVGNFNNQSDNVSRGLSFPQLTAKPVKGLILFRLFDDLEYAVNETNIE